MFQQGYIMRQIQQLTQALQQVLFNKKQGYRQEALDILQRALNGIPNDPEAEFHRLSLDETLQAMQSDGTFNTDLALAAADLLYEKGQLRDNDDDGSRHCYMQALLLYRTVMDDPQVAFPLEAPQKIEHIERMLQTADVEAVKRKVREPPPENAKDALI